MIEVVGFVDWLVWVSVCFVIMLSLVFASIYYVFLVLACYLLPF